jgi:hypothetical protein
MTPAKMMVYNTPTREMQSTIHNGTNMISHGHEINLDDKKRDNFSKALQ